MDENTQARLDEKLKEVLSDASMRAKGKFIVRP